MRLTVDSRKEKTLLPKIARAAVHLFVQKGIDGTTTKDIAHAAKVAEGALYRHFKSKDDLAWYLFCTHLNQFSSDLMVKVFQEKATRSRLVALVNECFSAFEEDRELFSYLILSEHQELNRYPEARTHPGHVVVKIIEEGQKQGDIRMLDRYVLASLVLGALIRVCVVRMYGNITVDLRRQTQEVSECLWEMVKR